MNRQTWEQLRDKRLKRPAAKAGYGRARQAFKMAERVREMREAKGLSQTELARRIGSTQPAIARLEAGGVAPSIDTLERIAGALGLELIVRFQAPNSRSPKPPRRTRLIA